MTTTLVNLELAETMCRREFVPERKKIFRTIMNPPYYAAAAGKNWAWLLWQRSKDLFIIQEEMKRIVTSLTLTPTRLLEADEEGCRDRMDWFALVCSIVSGDDALARLAAESAAFASASKKQPSFFGVVSGVLKARVLGDRKEELRQCGLLEKQRPEEPDIGPSIPLVKSFAERKYPEFAKQVAKGVARHWTDRFVGTKGGNCVIADQTEESLTLNIAVKSQIALWAHSEAVFAKLAMLDGAEIKTDDVWFPLDMIAPRT